MYIYNHSLTRSLEFSALVTKETLHYEREPNAIALGLFQV